MRWNCVSEPRNWVDKRVSGMLGDKGINRPNFVNNLISIWGGDKRARTLSLLVWILWNLQNKLPEMKRRARSSCERGDRSGWLMSEKAAIRWLIFISLLITWQSNKCTMFNYLNQGWMKLLKAPFGKLGAFAPIWECGLKWNWSKKLLLI